MGEGASEVDQLAEARGRAFEPLLDPAFGGVLVYDLEDPAAPRFITYVNTRTFTPVVPPATVGDLGPEGLLVISRKDSPTGAPLLVVSNEISGPATFYQIDGGGYGHGGDDAECDEED